LTAAQGAPIVAIALRAIKAEWRRPLSRAAQLFAVVGLFNLILYIPLMMALPNTDGRYTIWVNWHPHSPHVYDTLSIIGLVVCGIALLYVSALPDMHAAVGKIPGTRNKILKFLSRGWTGSSAQWRLHRAIIGVLGGLYFMFFVFVHFTISSDFAMSLVPGWKDAIFPAWHALSGLQSGVALVMVTLFILRIAGYKKYIGVNQFWSLSKIMLALTLLWAYFWFAGFLTFWYGRMPIELKLIRFLFVETYLWPFVLAVILTFAVPFLLLLWNGIRKSAWGPSLAGLSILIGTFFDRIRIYVASTSIKNPTGHDFSIPPAVFPQVADILIILGGLGGALLVYLIATKFIPILSVWETKEGLLYQVVKPVLKSRYIVMGKVPE
jgi:molybdopterin-containing oxidoreductase family membrane subunit